MISFENITSETVTIRFGDNSSCLLYTSSKLVNEIKQKAINGACELIQVAAMCEKFIESREVRESGESE